MSKWLTFASGWYKQQYDTLYCKGKDKFCNLYDTESKKGEKMHCKMFIETESGEKFEVTDFQVVANKRQREDKDDPSHEVKIKIQ